MKFISVKTYEELSKIAADIIAAQIIMKNDSAIYAPIRVERRIF